MLNCWECLAFRLRLRCCNQGWVGGFPSTQRLLGAAAIAAADGWCCSWRSIYPIGLARGGALSAHRIQLELLMIVAEPILVTVFACNLMRAAALVFVPWRLSSAES
jgi:hypothetical protein